MIFSIFVPLPWFGEIRKGRTTTTRLDMSTKVDEILSCSSTMAKSMSQRKKDNGIPHQDGASRDLFAHLGERIRGLRSEYGGGQGISQEKLAEGLSVATNTISRWETATYHPSIEDLDKLARFFGVSVLTFFPGEQVSVDKNERVNALLRAARDLDPTDLDELRRYAEFRRARHVYDGERPRPGRKPKQQA